MKDGIDYFPLDVALDEKFELIEAEFGIKGFGVVIKLLQRIYGGKGYYIEWTNDVALLFSKRIGLGGDVVSEIITASIKRGLFDETLFAKYSILTSAGIQSRYFEAVSRRKRVEVVKAYLLVDLAAFLRNDIIFEKNVDILEGNANILKQSRVKESKVKKIGIDARAERRFLPPTLGEVEAYCQELDKNVNAQRFIDYYTANGWMVGKNPMKDWKAALRRWGSADESHVSAAVDIRAERERFYTSRRNYALMLVEQAEKRAAEDPEYAEAVRIIKREEIALAKAELRSPELVSEINARLAEAKKKRLQALARIGLTEADFIPMYFCSKCSDTGFLPNGIACDCYKKEQR